MRLTLALLLLFLALVGRAQEIPVGGWKLIDATGKTEAGASLSQPSFAPDKAWFKATVPGTVLSSLVNDGVYPEPLYGENNRLIPEALCHAPYWYRTSLLIPKRSIARHPWLHFAGINYRAQVWVNGQKIGRIDGAFTRGDFDLIRYVTPGQTAGIAVLITPPEHPGTIHIKTQATGTGRNGGDMGADGPSFAAAVGWDWMPGIGDRDTGIWGPVTLDYSGELRIVDPYVTTSLPLPKTDLAKVTIQAGVRNLSDVPEAGTVTAEIGEDHFKASQLVRLAPGETKVVTFTTEMKHPKLWWPNGYGEPNLYDLKLTASDSGLSDTNSLNFGVRTIQYFPPGSKELGLIVNGVPVFAKGGNWGMDEAMKRSPRERLDAQIRFHRDANFTMIRNWVGMSTQEDFYDLCDKYGILVWDEFWLANPYDGPNPVDPDLFLANAREKLLRYRNHPSIAIWCGRNEGDPPANIEPGLVSLVAELDPPRLYQPHSAHYNGVGGGGPYAMRLPTFYFSNVDRFHTEIGAPSIPTLEAIKAMMPKQDWWPINDDWAEHDFCSGAQAGNRYPDDLAKRFGPANGLADFVRKAQLADYETYRAIYEGRNSKLFNPATGVLIWMSNPAQPSFVWQLYSHDLESDSALFGTRKACEPIHIQYDSVAHEVQVINNTGSVLNGVTARADQYDLSGKRLSSQSQKVDAKASAMTSAVTGVNGVGNGTTFLKLVLRDRHGNLLSDNFYCLPHPIQSSADVGRNLHDLDSLGTVDLEASAHRVNAPKGETWVEVTLRNPSKTVALLAHVQLRRLKSGTRVLPAFYTDNYVSLLPGETRSLISQANTKDFGGERPSLTVDGWNVGVKANEASPVPISTNEDARRPDTILVGYGNGPVPHAIAIPWQISCGSNSDTAGFISDQDLAEGGNANTQNYPVDLSALGDKAVSAGTYKSERWGEFSYRLPVPPNKSYVVRLHFADLSYKNTGGRKFNVFLNGNKVLDDFDLIAEAGGRGKAIIKEFSVAVGSDGRISLEFKRGSDDWPEVRAIQVLDAK